MGQRRIDRVHSISGPPTGDGPYVDYEGDFALVVPPSWSAQALVGDDGQRLVALTDPSAQRSVSVEVVRDGADTAADLAIRQTCGVIPAVGATTAQVSPLPGVDGGFKGVTVGSTFAAIAMTRSVGGRQITVVFLGTKDAVLAAGGDAPALAVLDSVEAASPRPVFGSADVASPRPAA